VTSLWDTTGKEIGEALATERRSTGAVAFGLVLSLVVVVDERNVRSTIDAATTASMAHPCRTLVVVRRQPGADSPRLDAEISIGGASGPGETIVLRTWGRLALHADSVVLPLLAPDAPVVTWWHGEPPLHIGHDPLGVLADRRVTDCAASADPLAALHTRAHDYRPGDTDLAWSRLSGWRSLLAAAFDACPQQAGQITISAARGNPSAVLLGGWLGPRLGSEVTIEDSAGPGITEVTIAAAATTSDDHPPGPPVPTSPPDGGAGTVPADGDVPLLRILRTDGRTAMLSRAGQPDRSLPLPRRERGDLLAEELRRLDADEVYAEALAAAFDLEDLNDRPDVRRHVWRDIGDTPPERLHEVLPGVAAEDAKGFHNPDRAAIERTAREMLAADEAARARATAVAGAASERPRR
jgi:glucose-6-phosphate dehydrogenase assembly protein OpcA